MKPYEYVEHTADMGLLVRGKSLPDLLKNAAQGLFETIAVVDTVDETDSVKIHLTAESVEDLFVEWLGELIFQHETKEIFFKRADIHQTAVKRRYQRRFTVNRQTSINTRFTLKLRVSRIINYKLCKGVIAVGLLRLFLISDIAISSQLSVDRNGWRPQFKTTPTDLREAPNRARLGMQIA